MAVLQLCDHVVQKLPHWNANCAMGHVTRSKLKMVPTNSKVFLRGLLNTREKQISTSVIEIQKEKWG